MGGSRDGRSSFNSLSETIKEEVFPFMPESEPEPRSRGTRSMSMVRGHIALSASSRTSLTHRLSQSIHQVVGPRNSTSPTLPIATRPRFHSTAWSTRSYVSHRQTSSVNLDTYDEGSAELTIRLSMDASQSRSYRMLLEGDSVISDLCVLEDEHQRTISAVQAGFGRKLIGLYFAATWSADCDEFTPVLQGLSSANRDDLVIVHVSVDNHPADMARLMAGSGWLSVPWTDRKLRQDLIERMGVSIAELPKLVIIDGTTHHIVSASGRLDVEKRPLTCVREWKKNRAGLSWWNKSKTWITKVLAVLLLWYVLVFFYSRAVAPVAVASSNSSSGITKPQMRATDRITSQPIATAHSRKQMPSVTSRAARAPPNTSTFNAGTAVKSERPTSRILRRHRSDEPARSRSPIRQADRSSQQQQQQQHTPVRVFGASKNAAAAQPIVMSGRQQSESAIGRGMRAPSAIKTTPVSSSQRTTQPSIQKTPSGLGSMRGNGPRAPSAESTSSSTTPAGNSSRRGIRAAVDSSPKTSRRPPPSPSIATTSNRTRLGSSLIPRPSERADSEPSAEARRRLYEENRELKNSLEVERSTNNEFLVQIKEMAAAFEALNAELEEIKGEKEIVHERVSELEQQLDNQRVVNGELQKKLYATESLLVAQYNSDSEGATEGDQSAQKVSAKRGKSASRNASSSIRPSKRDKELHIDSDPNAQIKRMQTGFANVLSVMLPNISKSPMDDETKSCIRNIETFMNTPSSVDKAATTRNHTQGSSAYQQNIGPDDSQLTSDLPSSKRTPQHRRVVEDERVKRRRSSVIFADFIAKSGRPRRLLVDDDSSSDEDRGGGQSGEAKVYEDCARCKQLTDSMLLLQVDNDYYRQANTKLRENVTDVVSKHNALVQLFEKERLRRREIRAQALTEATRAAANDRAMLEARQRAQLEAAASGEDAELSLQFDRAVCIGS
ncbi:hypothetical protein GGI15_002970 [Coemansia interrupta]|uniref:Thioredoxin-like fold domain-containing protein n=1 Tax=Coemansia interrupta TaxID=1126814 RepID=A0A9W8LJY2_9FUNG|nr:hypothetical protein GGI15_002970 [Coemansia interrupta]